MGKPLESVAGWGERVLTLVVRQGSRCRAFPNGGGLVRTIQGRKGHGDFRREDVRWFVQVPLRAAGHSNVGLVGVEDKDAETVEREAFQGWVSLGQGLWFNSPAHTPHKKCTDSPSAPILMPHCPPITCLPQRLSL